MDVCRSSPMSRPIVCSWSTNATLAAESNGVATHSLHMDGKAIDIRVPGIKLDGYATKSERPASEPFTIGYFARICPEKGLHVLVDAYCLLKKQRPDANVRLRVSGYFGIAQEQFLAACAGAVGHGREIEDVADLVQERGALPSPVDPP